MPRIALTELWLKHAHKRVDKPTEFTYDAMDFEFGVVVNPPSSRYPKGTKTFFTRYQYGGSRRGRKQALGRYPTVKLAEAIELAKEVQRTAARGSDPRQTSAPSREGLTFGGLFDEYYQERSVKKARPKNDYYIVRKHLRDWLPKPVGEISRKQARDKFRAIRDGGTPAQSVLAQYLVSAIFNWALDEELVVENPVHRLPLQGEIKIRHRYLSDDEIKRLLPVLRRRNNCMVDVLHLMLLTGQRKSELLKMRWRDLQDGCWWRVPGEIELANGRVLPVTKNRKTVLVYLTAPVLEILERRRGASQGAGVEWVFPRQSDPTLPRGGYFYREFHALRGSLGNGDDWLPHDLRRTVVTNLSRLGCPDKIKMAIVNHTYSHVHNRVYDMWEHAPEKMHWMTRWIEFLEAIEAGNTMELLPYAPSLPASSSTMVPRATAVGSEAV